MSLSKTWLTLLNGMMWVPCFSNWVFSSLQAHIPFERESQCYWTTRWSQALRHYHQNANILLKYCQNCGSIWSSFLEKGMIHLLGSWTVIKNWYVKFISCVIYNPYQVAYNFFFIVNNLLRRDKVGLALFNFFIFKKYKIKNDMATTIHNFLTIYGGPHDLLLPLSLVKSYILTQIN